MNANLTFEFPDKQRIISETEDALGRRTDEYDQYYKTSENKLNQLEIEGSDLRHELHRKDSEVIVQIMLSPLNMIFSPYQLQEVLHNLDGYMKKNEELRNQLKHSLDTMVEASSKYENKFSEIHSRVETIKLDRTNPQLFFLIRISNLRVRMKK